MSLRAALRVAPSARRVASAHSTHTDQQLYSHLRGQVVRRWQSGGADGKGSKLLPPAVLFGGKKPNAPQQRDSDTSPSIAEKHRSTGLKLLSVVNSSNVEEEEEDEESEQVCAEISASPVR